MWIAFTCLAAFMQAWRNALQSQLASQISPLGVTLARFLWAGPLAALYLLALHQWQPTPLPTIHYPALGFICFAALMQILATALMARLFQLKNFAVGAGLAKTEALFAAVLGMAFFGTQLSIQAWLGVLIGGFAVMLLSSQGRWHQLSAPTVLLGLASGVSFALTSLSVREAAIRLDVPFPHSAAWVLLSVISLQTVILCGYLAIAERHTLHALLRQSRQVVLISTTSCLGSIGWFSAMALTAVPLVKTLGQIEVFFMLAINLWWLKSPARKRENIGLVLVALAAVLVLSA